MKEYGFIFDMDGVIVHSNPFHKIAIRRFCEQHGLHLTEEELRNKVYGRTNRQWLTQLFGPLPAEQLQAYADEKEALFRQLYSHDIRAVRGLMAFLQGLDSNRIRRAIGTSAPRANVDFTLSRTGTLKFFPVILDESHVTNGKPDPEIYLKAAVAIGLPPEQCIVIEDSISGVQAGKAAGSKVIGITTTHSAPELAGTDLVIGDFEGVDPRELINRLFP